MRRFLAGTTVFAALTGVLLVLPVYGEDPPEPVAVTTSADEVFLGSLTAPAADAVVQEGTTAPVAGVPDTAPTLSITRTDVAGFSLVGVTWAHDPAVVDVLVQVRVQDSGGSWGSWTEVGTEDVARDPAGAVADADRRGGTSPLWTGPSTGVEVELVTRSGAAPTDVRLDLVDPGRSAADTSLQAPEIRDTADAAMAMPDVFSRAQWGADPGIRSWAPEYAATVKAATLHHTADTNNYSADQVPAMMRSIYRYHAVSLGWGDIGYNVIVDKFGRLWEGRDGGLASTVIGAHAGGFNTSTFGVSMLGNYDTAATPQVMVDAVGAIIAWKFSLFGVDPHGTATLTSGGTNLYPAGRRVTLPTVFGHRDTKSTACPGRYGYARLGEIRDRAAALIRNAVTPQITAHYDADPALRALLGAKAGPEQSAAGVNWQPYQGGALFYSPATGVKLVRGGVLDRYLRAGGPASLGAPTREEAALPDGRGVVAEFQRGGIYWTATTDAHVVRGAIRSHWLSLGGPSGTLGYPVEDERAADGQGAFSVFERGTVMWSPGTGPVVTAGGIRAVYEASGRETGPLGYPTAVEADIPGGQGRMQQFQRGAVYWSPVHYGALVYGGIGTTWRAEGGPTGQLGLPAGDERDTAGGAGRVQQFEKGAIYWSPAGGAHALRGAVLAAWTVSGAEAGPTGFPTSGEGPSGDGRGQVQRFQSGSIYWTAATGAHVVRGAVGAAWLASGGPGGPLGYPLAGERDTPAAGGRTQAFQQGAVYWSMATGARTVRGEIAAAYETAGGPGGALGLPLAEAVATADGAGRTQSFQGGSIVWSATTGAQVVRGAVGAVWQASGGVTGPLGMPRAGETDVPGRPGARMQEFQAGTVYWAAATGARIVRGDIAASYDAAGGAAGLLGLPVTEAVATADGAGRVQTFQSGSVYWSAATGAHVVRGAVGATWLAAGGPSGRLGYPTSDEEPTATGTVQRFQGGSISWTVATATAAVRPA
ncbi:N-acetylmuramoyl-L-alanine amidase [Blastococcus sp. SYSU DS0539]